MAAALSLAAFPSFAQTQERPPALKKFEEAGGTVSFLGSAYGTDGWLVKDARGGVQYAYTTPEGGLIVGMLFAPEGTSETKKQIEAYKLKTAAPDRTAAEVLQTPIPKAADSKAEQFYAEVDKAGWVALGRNSDAPHLYVFMNVNCDHCQAFWKDLESAVEGGRLQVRLVPFGESPQNRDGGAALLSAEDAGAAWRAYVGGDKSALSAEKAKTDAYARLDANTALAKTWKLREPPFTIYRRPGDGKVTAVVGRPANVLLLLAEFL